MTRLRPIVLLLALTGCQASTSPLDDFGVVVMNGLLEGSRSIEPFHPAVIRARRADGLRVTPNDAQTPFDARRAPRSLRLNLFADATFDARLIELGHHGAVSIWRGEVVGHSDSHVTLASRGETLTGTVRVDDRLFTIQPRTGGLLVVEWDESAVPTDAPAVVPSVRRHASIRAGRVHGRADGRADGGAEVDVLVLYTGAAMAAAGGRSAIETTIALAVEEASQSYADSGVGARLELLAARETLYDETDFDFGATLERLATPLDGFLDEAQSLRDELGADHVVLIVDHAGPYAGIGYQMTGANAAFFDDFAYSVVSRDYAAGFYTFAHELGHNMGAAHDPQHGDGGFRADSQGHQVPAVGYRTVMAYACDGGSCPRVGRWSNPALTHGGHPTGISGLSDNASTLDQTAAITAAFRDRPAAPPPAARIVEPAPAATLPAGAVRFEWTEVDADGYYLMIGRSPGDDSHFRAYAGRDTALVVEGLPEGGEALHARLWTLRGVEWVFVDHVFTAHRTAFQGATLALPGARLSSSWHWFGWDAVEGASEYRLEIGTAADPGRYFDRGVDGRYALVLGLPVDGSEVIARLHTRGPDGWVVCESVHDAWRAPSYAAVITEPTTGTRLSSTATFHWSATDATMHWLVLQTSHGMFAAYPVTSGPVHVEGLPTDGSEVMALLYSRGPDAWVATSAGFLTGATPPVW